MGRVATLFIWDGWQPYLQDDTKYSNCESLTSCLRGRVVCGVDRRPRRSVSPPPVRASRIERGRGRTPPTDPSSPPGTLRTIRQHSALLCRRPWIGIEPARTRKKQESPA